MSIIARIIVLIVTIVLFAYLKYKITNKDWARWALGISLLLLFIISTIAVTLTVSSALSVTNILKDMFYIIIISILLPTEKIPEYIYKHKT
jgi:hypothetical protein